MAGKGEIELKLDGFIQRSYERFGLNPNSDSMSRENAAQLMQELMMQHHQGDAWDRKQFD